VITGSWQGAAGYQAITGDHALFNPTFFESADARRDNLARHPDLVVMLDERARDAGVRAPSGWHEIGRWDDTVAYRPE
jgi:hypothetical protein